MTALLDKVRAPGADVLELVFQSSADSIAVLDLAGGLVSLNASGAASMHPTDPGQGSGQDWIGFWRDQDRDAARAALEAAKLGAVGRFDGCMVTAGGPLRWCRTSVTPVRDADGMVAQLLAVSRDISQQIDLAGALDTALQRTQAVIAVTSAVVWQKDSSQQNTSILGLAEFSGSPQHDSSRETWLSLIHADDRDRVDATTRAGMASGLEYRSEYRLRHRNGGYRWVEDRALPLRSDTDGAVAWIGVITDIDDRVTSSQALRDSEERLRLAVHASRVGIWDVDLVTNERRWSPDLKRMLGLPPEAVESEDLLFSLIHVDDRPLVWEAHRTAFRSGPTLTFRIYRADTGEERWILSSGQAVLDASGRARRLGTFQDVTDRKTSEHKLWTAANQDPLTGLPNRNLFNGNLDLAITAARVGGTRVALLIVDLDHFKEVNDTLGHHAGDVVLQAVAGRLKTVCGPSATIARLGGDEFAILVPDAGPVADLEALSGVIVETVGRPIQHGSDALICPASVGVAVFPDHDPASGELLKNADLALYAAKRSGRARYAIFDRSMKIAMQTRVIVLQRARDALAGHEIVPFYQPKVALSGRAHGGFEALLRWRDGTGIHGPTTLADAFDDPDLAAQIGQRMLDLVVADIVAWRAAGIDIGSVAINVAAAEFSRVDVAGRWLATIDEARLPPTLLQMEVTESVFLGEGSDAVDRALDALHASKVPIALDDFGTGFASLAHLRRYPVDWLKIDQSFVRDLATDEGARAIVSAVIGLAHGFGRRVIAEVETTEQAALLAEKGCDLAQGYLIAKPMAASRVPHFLRTWTGIAAPAETRRVALGQ